MGDDEEDEGWVYSGSHLGARAWLVDVGLVIVAQALPLDFPLSDDYNRLYVVGLTSSAHSANFGEGKCL